MSQHLARARTPKNWPIKRKETKWITRVNPGPHSLDRCINLNLLLKEFLKYAKTTREVRRILNQGIILIDKKPRKDPGFPVGLMDLIEVTKTKESYRLILDENLKFKLIPVHGKNQSLKPCKIIGKTTLKGKKTQINLFDGRNIFSDDKALNVGDTVILDLTTNKVHDHIKFEKDAHIYLLKGKNAGTIGVLKEIYKEKNMIKPRILVEAKKEKIETLKDYAFVINDSILENGTKHNEADQSK